MRAATGLRKPQENVLPRHGTGVGTGFLLLWATLVLMLQEKHGGPEEAA